jgi:hypothetical protein
MGTRIEVRGEGQAEQQSSCIGKNLAITRTWCYDECTPMNEQFAMIQQP